MNRSAELKYLFLINFVVSVFSFGGTTDDVKTALQKVGASIICVASDGNNNLSDLEARLNAKLSDVSKEYSFTVSAPSVSHSQTGMAAGWKVRESLCVTITRKFL